MAFVLPPMPKPNESIEAFAKRFKKWERGRQIEDALFLVCILAAVVFVLVIGFTMVIR